MMNPLPLPQGFNCVAPATLNYPLQPPAGLLPATVPPLPGTLPANSPQPPITADSAATLMAERAAFNAQSGQANPLTWAPQTLDVDPKFLTMSQPPMGTPPLTPMPPPTGSMPSPPSPPPTTGGPPPAQGQPPTNAALFTSLDTNKDGMLSPQEFANLPAPPTTGAPVGQPTTSTTVSGPPKLLANGEIDPTRIPLGDQKVSLTGPQKGFVYKANSMTGPGIGGASAQGPWFNGDGTFDSTKKITVAGNVNWPSDFTITRQGEQRLIQSNGLPNQPTGQFPIDPNSEAFKFDRNPNTIQAQSYKIALPANPTPSATPSPLPSGGPIGFLTDGTVLFDGLDAVNRDAVAHEVQDANEGHPEINGSYHHHSIPKSMWESDDPTKPSTKVVGWALDGYPITGPRGDNGKILTNTDLDEFHGRTSMVEVDGQMVETYHYVATLEYPYTLGAFKGTPVTVEGYKQPSGPPPGMGGPPLPPMMQGVTGSNIPSTPTNVLIPLSPNTAVTTTSTTATNVQTASPRGNTTTTQINESVPHTH